MTSRLGLWCATVLSVLLLSSMPVHAQDAATKAQARENFQRGIEQYGASQYEPALESFQEAYRLSPHPMVRVNMANCYDRLGKPIEALFHFTRFMSETEGDRSRAEQRTEVEAAMKRLKRSLGEVNLRVIPDGSLVRVDDTEERRAPIVEPLVLPAGEHVIRVTRPGFATVERRIQVRGGASETVDITLQREGVAAAAAPAAPAASATSPAPAAAVTTAPRAVPPPPAPAPQPRVAIAPLPEDESEIAEENPTTTEPAQQHAAGPMSIPPLPEEAPASDSPGIFTPPVIVAGVVSGSFLVGAVLLGLAAASANSDFDSFAAQANNPALSMRERIAARDDALAAADRADGRALTADLFLGAALIAGGVAAYFILTQDEPGEDATVTAGIGPGSVAFSARF